MLMFQILTREEYEGMQIEGNKYRGMGLAGALNLAQFVVLMHPPGYRTLNHLQLSDTLSYLRSRCSRNGKEGYGGWAGLFSVGLIDIAHQTRGS